jgi:BioD-like phosphotransacetylase family protein
MEDEMATTLYVTSTQNFSGKSALCVGLLGRFRQAGLKIGYMKPVSTTARIVGDRVIDEDTDFIKSAFNLVDPLAVMTPVLLTDQKVTAVLEGNEEDLTNLVYTAFQAVVKNKDVVVLEGGGSLREGWIINLAPPHVSELLKTKVLVVVPFQNDLQMVDDLITARVRLGDALLGSVINRVPGHRLEFVLEKVKNFVEPRGVPIFGVFPRERVLLSVSVRDLLEGLKGEILCGHQALDELVEHFLVGAMSADSALAYFRRKANKAVITGGDRPDIQLAAMETSTRCIILTGNIMPGAQIVGQAEMKRIPIILTRQDTMTTLEQIEKFFGKTRFHQKKKVKRFDKLLNEHMDFDGLKQSLGLL